MSAKEVVDVLSAAVAPVTACIAAYIAYQQWLINRTKLRLDLYDRRVTVLRAVKEFLSAIAVAGAVKGEALSNYVRAVAEADFLFDKRLRTYLDEIYKKSVRMLTLKMELGDMPFGPDRTARVKEEMDLLKWMAEQGGALNEEFKRYLSIR
jgi:hypothetical protein